MYFIFTIGGDGDIYFSKYSTKEALQEAIKDKEEDMNLEFITKEHMQANADGFQGNLLDDMICGKEQIIIEGEVVEPVEKKVVIEYDIE